MTTTTYSLTALRALALYAQGLSSSTPLSAEPIFSTIQKIGAVQIDTLQMVHRSHYLVLWSRLGHYSRADFDVLIYNSPNSPTNHRQLFEYWYHAACIIPLSEYRYRLPLMNRYKTYETGWFSEKLRTMFEQPEYQQLKAHILHEIKQNGGARASDYEHKREMRGTWWDWKPAKHILEHLYNAGDLMIANRINFNRVYDLREKVLPEWVDTTVPSEDAMRRHLLEQSLKALGVCQPLQIADYTQMKRGDARHYIEAMVAEGLFVPITGTGDDGKTLSLVVHREQLLFLEKAADGVLPATHTTFLSPFDNLFWAQKRDEQFWGFEQTLEAYKPAPIRRWGYFCLPILYRDCLIGRFDPKMERKTATLRLKTLYLENTALDDEIVDAVAGAMRRFMAFHEAKSLVIEKSFPSEFGDKLMKAL